MDLPTIMGNLTGEWVGTNLLRLSWQEPSDFVSDSTMTVSLVAMDKFLTLRQTWSHEGAPHEGFLLLGCSKETREATGAWGDSWHQSGGVLQCRGTIDEKGVITLKGSYPAPEGPDWGWSIIVSADSGKLRLEMYNISPDGEEDLAVRAEYSRK